MTVRVRREWTKDLSLWVQPVSSMPATRLEVVALQEELDRRLQQRQARETGICPVRRELYTQCFGLLILCHQSSLSLVVTILKGNTIHRATSWHNSMSSDLRLKGDPSLSLAVFTNRFKTHLFGQ